MSNKINLKKGTKVEIKIEKHGFPSAWFPATILKQPSKSDKNTIMVEYDAILTHNEKTPLREKVNLVQIRWVPPREIKRVFKLHDKVDVFCNGGWWVGVVTHVLECGRYIVCFEKPKTITIAQCIPTEVGSEDGRLYFRPPSGDNEFNGSDLRLHREWVDGNWVPPLEEMEVQPAEEKINKEKEEKNFCKGSLVEVSSDEDGFDGAWFSATLLEVIGKDKFRVEYSDLRTEDDSDFVREEVDALHVRPCPPKTKAHEFKQSEEVDALYNDGWWVGIISKVLGQSKYLVYFRDTNEQLEFNEDQLRVHQDWIDGKWVIASKAIDLSD